MTRETLPNRRLKVAFPIEHAGQMFTASVGLSDDGRALETFLNARKTASDMEALGRDAAIIVSLALQHGVPLATLVHAVTRGEGDEPASLIRTLLDAVMRETDTMSGIASAQHGAAE